MLEPQTLTITAWAVPLATVEQLDAQPQKRGCSMAIMAMNSVNLKSSTLCHMGAFILRELGKQFGLERASEIVFQTAQGMTMRAQFRTGPEEAPYEDNPADEYGDTEPNWGNDWDGSDDEEWDDQEENDPELGHPGMGPKD